MIILYQIALGITAFGAAVIAFNIILKKTKIRTRFDIFYGLLACSLIIWAVGRYGLLITDQYNLALFWVHLLYFGSILVHVFFLHVILIFLDIENKRKTVLIIFYINAAFLLVLNSIDFISGSNYFIKDVIPKLNFNYYEEPNIFYNLHLINYIFIPFYALFEMILALRNSTYEKKQQLKLIIFSSILGFFGGNSVVPLVYNIQIEPFLLILVPFHLLTLAYAITKHHLFNIKTIATELLTFAIWIAVLFELLIADTWKERIFEGGLLLFVIVFGILLIKSVLKEVHQREQMEKLSKELEKLNSQLSIRTQQLTSLKDFTTSLIKTLDFKEIIQLIVNGIVERFNYPGVFLTGITDDGKYLYPLAISQNKPVELALKLLPKKLEDYREEIENNPSLAAQAIQTNSIQISEDFGKFFSAVSSIMLRGIQSLIGFKTALAIPVIAKGKVLGVLNVAILKGEKEIGISELELLNTIANQIAIVLTNAKLFQQIEEANAKLIELDKAKAGMYSFVSHQIKAPIGIVKGFAQLLLDDSYGKLPKKAKERVEDMKKSCDRLIQLVNDFLDLRRIEEGRMEYEFKEINLVDLVKSVFEELRFLAEQKKLEFTLECAEKEIKIKADEQRMRQVIQNLIENSIKYTEKGFVKVSLKLTTDNLMANSYTLMTISDSGMGIKPDVLPQLFDQFKRAKEARLIQGTGLGLFIAREIVKAHKGDIWAESEGEGKGSKFYVRLGINN